jgi:copper oxidase (laccase) domain-containing protein
LHVVLGPCIGPCCFEVGGEVEEAFAAAMPAAGYRGVIVPLAGHKPHVDLRCFHRSELEAAGVLRENIDASTDCTLCDAERRFYSFRSAGRATGQSVGFILRV